MENREIDNYTILGIPSLQRTYDRYQRTAEFYEKLIVKAKQTGLRYDQYPQFKEGHKKAIQRRDRINAEIHRRLTPSPEPRSIFCYKPNFF